VQDFSINVLLAQVFTAKDAKVRRERHMIDYCAEGAVINKTIARLCDLCGKNIFVLVCSVVKRF
jgi:hypothetical protein